MLKNNYMKMKKIRILAILIASFLFVMCQKDNYIKIVNPIPTVVKTDPANLEVNVPLDKVISVKFSAKMDKLSINKSSFTVFSGVIPVEGVISSLDSISTFTPSAPLTPNTTYTATIKSSIQDLLCTKLDSNHVWTFKTSIEKLNVIVSSNPTAGGTTTGTGTFDKGTSVIVKAVPNVGYVFVNWTNGAAIASTSQDYTFVLNTSTTLVANFIQGVSGKLSVSLSSNPTAGGTTVGAGSFNKGTSVTVSATANPNYKFDNWTEGTVVKSTNSNYTFLLNTSTTLIANFISSTLPPVTGNCPTIIDLGLAGNYAILSESGISTTGTTSITGDIGVNPVTSTSITGFGLILPASGAFSTSSLITGNVYAPDYAVPTPANLVTATNNMHTAYTTANGLTIPAPKTEIMAGNFNGQTLTPGIYKFSNSVIITNSLILDGGGDNCATFIFQIAGDLTVANSTIIKLQNGVQAKNVFWIVAGSKAALGTSTDFSGNILCKTLISLNTGSKVTGKLFAQTAVTLNASTVVNP